MKVFVAGSDGYLGWSLARHLAGRGAVIGHALTPYGSGHQRRGFLPLADSMACLTLALDHPPGEGEYRVLNQFQEVYSVTELAEKVRAVGNRKGLDVTIQPLENPRVEREDHHYNPEHQGLRDLGYEPTTDVETELGRVLDDLTDHRSEILKRQSVFVPDIRWNAARRPVSARPVADDAMDKSR